MEYLKYLQEEIHSVVFATTDNENRPITCVIDIMLYDKNNLYFLTAKGKNFYNRLKNKEDVSLTGFVGKDTMSSKSVTITGKAKEIGSGLIDKIFENNPYMSDIYPSELSRQALTVFAIYEGQGEFFDLSQNPIFRESFSFGNLETKEVGYNVNENCNGCGACIEVCPQGCIELKKNRATIINNHCLHCGRCMEVCTLNAINKN